MRLGACALVLAVSAALTPGPAHAQQPDKAVEVVNAAITGVRDHVAAAGVLDRRIDRQPVRESFLRDLVVLRDLRSELRSDRIGDRTATRVALRTASCAAEKYSFGVVAVSRLRHREAENAALESALLEAHDPEGEDAARIEELIGEARELDLAAAAHVPAVTESAARVRCHRPDTTFAPARSEHDAAIADFDDASLAADEAARLMGYPSGAFRSAS